MKSIIQMVGIIAVIVQAIVVASIIHGIWTKMAQDITHITSMMN